MEDIRESLISWGLIGLGFYAWYKLSEWAAREDRRKRLEIEATKHTEVVEIADIYDDCSKREQTRTMRIPIRRHGGGCHDDYIEVPIPHVKETSQKYLITKDKRVFLIPKELEIRVIPFKTGELAEITSVQLPDDDYRRLEDIRVPAPVVSVVVEKTEAEG